MVTGVGSSVSALQGQIQQVRVQLDDWTSCVSAKTPKGQAAIQKLSGEISADKQKIAHAQQQQQSQPDTATVNPRGGSVDVWA